MNTKFILTLIAFVCMLALTNAQGGGAPALTSLSSKIESISASYTGSNKPTLMSSASSAMARISSAMGKATSLANTSPTGAPNSGTALVSSWSSTAIVQVFSLAALFVVGFVAALA